MGDRPRILIAGASAAGLALAHGMRGAGIPVRVVERRPDRDVLPPDRWIGINPDGDRALRQLLPPELFATFVASCARPIRHFRMVTEQLDELIRLDVPAGGPHGSERSVNRATLRRLLLAGLEDVVEFGTELASWTTDAGGAVTARFADGTSATADVLVGADGTRSTVRRRLLPGVRLECTGLRCITGCVPLDDTTRAMLPEGTVDGVTIVSGPHGDACVLHVVDLPWGRDGRPKDRVPAAEAALLAADPALRPRPMGADGTRDYLMVGFTAAASGLPPGMLGWDGPELLELVRSRIGDWHPALQVLVARADPWSCSARSVHTSGPPPVGPPGPVTLVGDAAHTMAPGRGVGPSTALRDAALLCAALAGARPDAASCAAAVAAYEEQMRAYAAAAVRSSRDRMTGRDPVYWPYVGRVVLAGRRSGLRVVNQLPAVKRRMAERRLASGSAQRTS